MLWFWGTMLSYLFNLYFRWWVCKCCWVILFQTSHQWVGLELLRWSSSRARFSPQPPVPGLCWWLSPCRSHLNSNGLHLHRSLLRPAVMEISLFIWVLTPQFSSIRSPRLLSAQKRPQLVRDVSIYLLKGAAGLWKFLSKYILTATVSN